MRLRVTYVDGERSTDLAVTTEPAATVGALAEFLLRADPSRPARPAAPGTVTLAVQPGTTEERLVPPATPLGVAGIRSGAVVTTAAHGERVQRTESALPPAARLTVVEGPDAGRTFPLASGSNLVGRARECEVRLNDPMVSKQHVRVNVTDVIEVIDLGSANGVEIAGEAADRARLRPSDQVRIGDTVFSVTLDRAGASGAPVVEFNRPPRLDPRYRGVELVAPEPPQPPALNRFPLVPLLAPLVMGGVMFAVTGNAASVLFVALSPLMLIGSYLENRSTGSRAMKDATKQFRAALTDLAVQLQYAAEAERAGRRREHPAVAEVTEAVLRRDDLLWTRRPGHDSFLQVRLGLGAGVSRSSVKQPAANRTTPELWRELQEVAGRFAVIDRVPVVGSLRDSAIGVCGPPSVADAVVHGIVAQVVGLHSPAEVVLAAVASGSSAARWEWLVWLPHVGSPHAPFSAEPLAANDKTASALVAELSALVDSRAADAPATDAPPPVPAVVLVVEDDAPVERARLVDLAERGARHGVHVLWCAPDRAKLPAACRTYLDLDPVAPVGTVGFVDTGEHVAGVEVEGLAAPAVLALARRLAPLVDAGALLDDVGDLPPQVSFLALNGQDTASSAAAVIERWEQSDSLPVTTPGVRRPAGTLRAVVGQGAAGPFQLDLRANGPHALVGGTTGAGKSEFLQSWILGMASAHSPARVTFLFVDYKGGAAFADCVKLPHCVGLVTDLSPHLVQRALASLKAELRHREHLLNRRKAKDLLELEKRSDPEAPPSLVIVVDEFAALVGEVPEFVDGVVDVAQRGRSLGLHLVLATQRPAGVIKDNLRANTALRIALRMADEADSTDVIGLPVAAGFDPGLPGRAIAKTGPGRTALFQSAYAGGWTAATAPPPRITCETLRFGAGITWDVPGLGDDPVDRSAPNDIARVVATIRDAAERAAVPAPRKPWLPALAAVYELASLPSPRTDRELVFGVLDDPDNQSQPTVAFLPDQEGNMAVFGTSGSGKSTVLRTLAVAAGLTARGGPCIVHGLDFATRGLQMLEVLPHVAGIVAGDDGERVGRLLRLLRTTIDERAGRFAAVAAASLPEYRERSGRRDEPRLLLLVDGMGAFRQAYEAAGDRGRLFDLFQQIASDGRQVGVHVVVTADRPSAIPGVLASAVQRRLVLRLASENDYAMVGAPADGFSADAPAGRGFLDGREVQVAVFGGDRNVAVQATALGRLAKTMRTAGVADAEPIGRLGDRILLSELPPVAAGRPTIGVAGETLEPIGVDLAGAFLVAGPPASGRTTALATLLTVLHRQRPDAAFAYFGTARSPLGTFLPWAFKATTADEAADLAADLHERLGREDPGVDRLVVVVEGIAEFLNGSADYPLQELLGACRRNDRLVLAESETSTLGQSWPLLGLVKSARTGLVLQPEQMDGDVLFRTGFPRMNRGEFPPGRGLLVRAGRADVVQIALPE
jgi:S-DNA-T family DNA segregation ATPase FtsK/SpoIIIE